MCWEDLGLGMTRKVKGKGKRIMLAPVECSKEGCKGVTKEMVEALTMDVGGVYF